MTAAFVGALCLPMQGCFTFTLWGAELIEVEDHRGKKDLIYSFENSERTWGQVLPCVLLTPIALCLDCVTMPFQALLFMEEEEAPIEEDDWR